MLHNTVTSFMKDRSKSRNWFCISIAVLMIADMFGPGIFLAMFHIHFDDHLAECQHHRNHSESCQATCILSEILSKNTEEVGHHISYSFYFSQVLHFQGCCQHSLVLLRDILVMDRFVYYLKNYSIPYVGIQTPPPQFSVK